MRYKAVYGNETGWTIWQGRYDHWSETKLEALEQAKENLLEEIRATEELAKRKLKMLDDRIKEEKSPSGYRVEYQTPRSLIWRTYGHDFGESWGGVIRAVTVILERHEIPFSFASQIRVVRNKDNEVALTAELCQEGR